MRYLLDTNACIALINERPRVVRARLNQRRREGAEIYVSSVVSFELWYGVSKSQRRRQNSQLLAEFLSGPVASLPFDEHDARVAGELRASLERIGRPISQYDLLIAGQAVRHSMTLVTANTREFARVQGLAWEDWTTTLKSESRYVQE